jgi:hypothetical protein
MISSSQGSLLSLKWPTDRDPYEAAFEWLDMKKVELVDPEEVAREHFQKSREVVFESLDTDKNINSKETRSISYRSTHSNKFRANLSVKTCFSSFSMRAIKLEKEEEDALLLELGFSSPDIPAKNRIQSERSISISPPKNPPCLLNEYQVHTQ